MILKISAILCLIVGPYLIFSGQGGQEEFDKLRANGVEVPGLLTKGESRVMGRRLRSWEFDVEWKTKEGRNMKQHMVLSQDFAKPRLRGDSVTDPEVIVCHLPSDPAKAFVVGAKIEPKDNVYAGVAASAAGLVGTIYLFRKR
jgi:hypothetical protein